LVRLAGGLHMSTVNNGLSWAPKTLDEIKEDMNAAIKKLIGEDADTSPGSVFGQIVDLQAKAIKDSFDFSFKWTLPVAPVGVISNLSWNPKFEIQEWARIRRECAAACTGTTKLYTFDGGRYTFYRDPETAAEHGKDIEPGADGVCWYRW